jgi:hypothetical protein
MAWLSEKGNPVCDKRKRVTKGFTVQRAALQLPAGCYALLWVPGNTIWLRLGLTTWSDGWAVIDREAAHALGHLDG